MSAGSIAFSALRSLLAPHRSDENSRSTPQSSPSEAGTPAGYAGAVLRDGRDFQSPQDLLDRALAQKILDGWLQNRHQVLVPLTFRLGRLPSGGSAVLMQFAASAVLLGSSADPRSVDSATVWLRTVGADAASLRAFEAALETPRPLSAILTEVRSWSLEPYAYAAAVSVADTRNPAGRLFANFIAARLALPVEAIRSIDRRYRR